MLGAFKLDHLQSIEPILCQKIFNFFTFILGGQFLLPQRANNEKRGFIQLQNGMRQRGFSAWAIQLTHQMRICIQYLVSTYSTELESVEKSLLRIWSFFPVPPDASAFMTGVSSRLSYAPSALGMMSMSEEGRGFSPRSFAAASLGNIHM